MRAAAAACCGLVLAAVLLLAYDLFAGAAIQEVRALWLPLAVGANVLAAVVAGLAGWLLFSPRARAVAYEASLTVPVFFCGAVVLSAWLSFGPHVTTKGFWLAARSIYAWLYWCLPGFDGLRVAARIAMLVAFSLALMGGVVAAVILRVKRWWSVPLLAGLCLLFLAEGLALPLPLAPLEWRVVDDSGRQMPMKAAELEPLYALVSRLPPGTVVAEFPLGGTFDDVRAAYFSVRHGNAIVNGYSGELPPSYRKLREILERPSERPDASWSALAESGATCAIVHEWAIEGAGGRELRRWLESHGARVLGVFGQSRVYALPRAGNVPPHS
jgi:hypothetical protein